MNFLPYILLWIFGKASRDNKWNACRNNTSGDKGICLSEWLCVGKGGLIVGTCTSSVTHNICCKILFVTDNEVNNASSVTPPNIFTSYEESKTDSTFSKRNPVLLDVSHDPQNTVDVDSADNQLNVFQKNYSSEQNQEISTNKLPYNDQNYSSDNLRLSVKLDPELYLRNHVALQAKKYLPKPVKKDPTFSPQKSNQEDLSHNQKLHESNPEHNLEKLVNGIESRVSKFSIKQQNHDLRNPVQVNVSNYIRKPVQTDFTFNLQNYVQIDSSHNPQNQVLTGLKSNHPKIPKGTTTNHPGWPVMLTNDHDLRNDVPTNDLRKPVQTDIIFYSQKPVQVDPSHDLRKVVKISNSHDLRMSPTKEPGHDLRNPDHVRTINIHREPVKTDSTFHQRKPVQVDLSHNLRKVVKVSDSHDLRWPLIQKSDHDLRNPVQVHATNDLHEPVRNDFKFNLQKPVQVDSSHDLRKTVKVADSHDLRWPTVLEPDHDLRNPDADIDLFGSGNVETKLDNIIQAYAKKTSKNGKNKKNHDPIYEVLDEDGRIKSNCALEFWSWNNIPSENKEHLENLDIRASLQKVLFRNSTKVCGIPYNESTENLDFQESNSNLGPWMVSVQEYFFGKFRHKCGGSLLNNLWVITAAHCVDLRPKWDFLLKLGTESNGESHNYIERLVNKISIHPKYNNINFDSDIALLRMDLPVIFQSNIVPICLPDIHESMEKRKAVVLGWQVATRRKESAGSAQAETVPVLTNKECEVMFSETGVNESIEKNFVCAGTRSVKQSCAGDSGGPLAVLDSRGRWSLAGLYSWGKTCKIPNQPEVYISVTSYVNWIEETIACFEHYINLGRINS